MNIRLIIIFYKISNERQFRRFLRVVNLKFFFTKIKTKATLTKHINYQKNLSYYFGNIEKNRDLSRIHLAVHTSLMFKDSIQISNGVSDFQI